MNGFVSQLLTGVREEFTPASRVESGQAVVARDERRYRVKNLGVLGGGTLVRDVPKVRGKAARRAEKAARRRAR